MIKDSSYKKLMICVSAFVLVAIIGIAYAAFTGNLNISGSGINRKSNYDIYFNNVSNFLTTGTATVANSNPTVRNHTTVIEDYEATLATPGDSIYFTFDIVNDGDYEATLTSLTLGPVKCSVNGDESDISAENVCSNIEYTMKYTSDNSNVSVNDTLASKETKEVKVTLTYKDFSDSSKLPTSNVTITNLGIDMVYTADSEAKTNSDGSTPWVDPYTIGAEITLLNEKYNVIGSGEDYVTLLKQQPLTVDEVNLYGGVGTSNNHVNMYNNNKGPGYRQAYNNNGLGIAGMAYYTSENCGHGSDSNQTFSGCTTSYDDSEIKYVVDAWAEDKFTNNELKIVDGYSARLVKTSEIQLIGWPSCGSIEYCNKENTTPNWLYAPNYEYDYWTMSQWKNVSDSVWYVDANGYIYGIGVSHYHGAVRPVINVYKDKI